MTKRPSIVDQLRYELRQAIEKDNQDVVAKATRVNQSVLSRFINDDRGISLETADKLCRYLGLVLKHKSAE